jgi:carbamoyl-phosphate synthase large subunit
MKNILITSAGRRVSLLSHFKTAAKELNLDIKVYITDLKPILAPAFYFSDGEIKVPPTNSPDFIEELILRCKESQIGLIIPTSDLELEKLSLNRELLLQHNINVVISDTILISKCRDKRLTDELFNQIGLNIINKQDKSDLKFPVFVKPYNGSLSSGIATYYNLDEIPISQLTKPDLIWMDLMPKEEYDEYTVDCYFDLNSQLKCLVPRKRLEVRGGEISKGVTVKGELYNNLVSIMRNLTNARGCITLQVFISKDSKEAFGIEINPRFGGGFPLSYHAGAAYPNWIIKEYLLNEKLEFYEDWQDNKYMIRFDQEIVF